MQKCTLVAGVNGVGKSSWLGVAENLRTDLGMMMDDTMDSIKFITENANTFFHRGVDFTIETTLDGEHIEAILRKASQEEYQITLHYIALDTFEECFDRVDRRAEQGGRMVPEKIVYKRFERRFESLKQILPYCHSVVFWDNKNVFRVVAEYRNGSFIRKGDMHPAWTQELHEILWWKEERK
ncbi:MAG: hypothetical protein HFJ84_09120 [Clostridiales bacterium]|jgi:predicted ABC-type ATPase|nr:hypothetical protein [Clostridiales bacterium]